MENKVDSTRVRLKALELFTRVEEEGAYSNILIAKDKQLSKDNPFSKANEDMVLAIVYGTIEKKLLLDYYIDKFLKKEPPKRGKQIRNILRIGTYQLLFMNAGSDYGICNDMVTITKGHFRGFEGLVNGVLRNIARSKAELSPPVGDDIKSISIRYSIGADIIRLWVNSYGIDKTKELAAKSCEKAPLFLRVNLSKNTKDEAVDELLAEGISCHAMEDELSSRAIIVEKGYEGRVVASKCLSEGRVSVQDLASIVAIDKLDIKPTDNILDMCSAPGGKGVSAGELAPFGSVLCWDIFQHKIGLIESYAMRCGLDNIRAERHSALDFRDEFKESFHKVILDPPCSGLGVIRRRPEIRYKNMGDNLTLSQKQFTMLTLAARYVKPKGSVLYSTCTVNPMENQDVVNKFLNDTSGEDFEKTYERQIFTGECGADGFYICILKRRV